MPYTPEVTKASIFAAAVAEFASVGFSGARVDRIAANAGVDKTSIYAHFGNKRALFSAVLSRELGTLSEALAVDPTNVAESVGRFFDYQRAHPEHVRLLMWEALEFTGQPVPGEESRGVAYRHRALGLDEAQRADQVDDALDSAGLWLVLAGMVNWTLALPQITRMTLGGGPEALDRQRELIVECVRRLVGKNS